MKSGILKLCIVKMQFLIIILLSVKLILFLHQNKNFKS